MKTGKAGSMPKVLIVDDDATARRLIEAILQPIGIETFLACNGEEAVERVKSVDPDVILLDVLMPKMTGLEAARILKGDEETKIIPIVMITALNDVADRVKALEAGADDFLNKPVEMTELRARVSSLLKVKAYNEHMQNYSQELAAEVNRKTKELRSALRKIKKALQEKDVMLREVYHRVNNNMQLVVSLLRLQISRIHDPRLREEFQIMQNRIISMAFVHMSVYPSKEWNEIKFSSYVDRITTHLYSRYRARNSNLTLEQDVSDISLDINTAIPLGMMINELITNSLIHAFSPSKKGTIGIELHVVAKGRFELVITDSGKGLPADIDPRNPSSLGLQLVKDLTEQIGGTIQVERNGGTTFKISWEQRPRPVCHPPGLAGRENRWTSS